MERLMGFFVVFHRAVKPVSRMPILPFDMDGSESRLRVASTPAPVPFVEGLSGGTPASMTALEELETFQIKISGDSGESQLIPQFGSQLTHQFSANLSAKMTSHADLGKFESSFKMQQVDEDEDVAQV
jgi:hypothetical protein